MLRDVTIGPLRREDIDSILEVEQETPTAPHWHRADYEKLFVATPTLMRCGVVARFASTIAGFAIAKVLTVEHYDDAEAELESIVVRADAQRKGVGSKLVSALVERLGAAGIEVLRLEVRSSNLAAISLYRACNFSDAGVRRRYYRDPEEDALLMEVRFRHPVLRNV